MVAMVTSVIVFVQRKKKKYIYICMYVCMHRWYASYKLIVCIKRKFSCKGVSLVLSLDVTE